MLANANGPNHLLPSKDGREQRRRFVPGRDAQEQR
jgi:hypothetical protein